MICCKEMDYKHTPVPNNQIVSAIRQGLLIVFNLHGRSGFMNRCMVVIGLLNVLAMALLSGPAQAQRVESCMFNKDGFYNSAWYPVAKESDWQSRFSSSADYNSFSVCFYKVYSKSAPTGSSTANAVIGSFVDAPQARLGIIGYVLYYWKDGSTEQDAVTNNWRKVINPNLECTSIGTCCSTRVMMNQPNKCGAAWAIENGFDWRQSSLQCITLGDLAENQKYHFIVYVWTCPSTTIVTMPNGYYSDANYPPKYETLRNQQAVPYIQWGVWIAKGTFVTSAKPKITGGGFGGIRHR